MSIRFLIGRAGSGKTYRCLEEVRARLRENAAQGHKLLLLVPEQASYQMERALIETPDIPGYSRCEVLSFQRLAYRIFAETGTGAGGDGETIGSIGRLMLIRRIIRQEQAALQILGRVADKPGLIRQVSTCIEELMRENVSPEVLAGVAEHAAGHDPLQSARLADLARLYNAYLQSLAQDRLDPAQHLTRAAERAGLCPWLAGAELWVDGFAGFSGQEYELLVRLARLSRSMEIALLADPDTPAASAMEIPPWSFSVFSRTEKTMVLLRRRMTEAGLAFGEPIRLRGAPSSRFGRPALARLEAHLFQAASSRAQPARQPPVPVEHAVRVLELPDRRCEVDAAVAEVERLRREATPPMRYRDIAVIVRDLAPYHDLLSAAFQAHGVPCFIDRRLPTTQHPLVETVRALLGVAADDCGLESVRLLLKTGLLPITTADGDLLENYLLAHGIMGRSAWEQPWHYTRIFHRKPDSEVLGPDQQAILEQVNRTREQWLASLAPWLRAAFAGREAPGREWAQHLYACLEHLHAADRLHEWAKAAEAAGQPGEADAHRQVWADFVEMLDEFVRALGEERMTLRAFQETLEAGLAEFNLGLAPATLDQVLIGAIERSRHPPVRAVLLLGFDDRHFPMRPGENPLLGDAERRSLERAGAPVGTPRDQQLLDERMLAYIALTRASEHILITYPRSEADGSPVHGSAYLRDVLAALPGLEVYRQADPRGNRSAKWLMRSSELGARLAHEFRCRPEESAETDLAGRRFWNALYEAARGRSEWRLTLGRCLGGLKYGNTARLEEAVASRLLGQRFAASVSRLERFAACPFAHYVEYLLRLEPRAEADMGDVDLGNLCHMILEKFIGDLADAGQVLGRLEDDEISERVDQAATAIVPRVSDELMLTEARNAFLLGRSREHLCRVLRWQRNSARAGTFNPRKVEYPFGFAEDGGGTFRLVTPAKREVFLRGRIDRVDLAELGNEVLGLVIDYKHTTFRRLDLAKAYHGLALQLVGYLLALQQSGRSLAGRPIRPVAAFYLPLLEPYRSVCHPSENKSTTYQWRGIADVSALPALDAEVQPGGRSRYLAARLNQSGEPHGNCDLARTEHFEALMAHTGRRMGELADLILDGDISVSPYRLQRQTPCSWCTYRPVCRHEIACQPPRTLEDLRKSEVLARLKGGGA